MSVFESEYDLKSQVKIKSLNVAGLIIGFYYGETGFQYQVAYFVNGDRRTAYLYPEEICMPNGKESTGFVK
jgi:hypothetical protein